MSAGDWRDRWEAEADAETQAMAALSLAELLRRVRHDQLGEYHTIWRVLAQRRDLRACGWVLCDFLHRSNELLPRHHCATTLLALLPGVGHTSAEIGTPGPRAAAALADIEARLTQAIGPRP